MGAGTCPACGGELYQREDDKPDAVRNRLIVYEEQTSMLIQYYRNQGKLVEINGSQNVEEVTSDLLKSLEALTGLKELNLSFTQVGDDALAAFRKAVPGCEVKR